MLKTEAQDIIDRITYKNYRIRFSQDAYEDYYLLQIYAPVKDACLGYAYSVAPEITITTVYKIDASLFERFVKTDFIRLIQNQIIRLETHEVYEHFKLDGVCVVNPHPEQKTA